MKNIKAAFLILSAGIMLTSCGIKPDDLAPPSDDLKKEFPGTYPADETLD